MNDRSDTMKRLAPVRIRPYPTKKSCVKILRNSLGQGAEYASNLVAVTAEQTLLNRTPYETTRSSQKNSHNEIQDLRQTVRLM